MWLSQFNRLDDVTPETQKESSRDSFDLIEPNVLEPKSVHSVEVKEDRFERSAVFRKLFESKVEKMKHELSTINNQNVANNRGMSKNEVSTASTNNEIDEKLIWKDLRKNSKRLNGQLFDAIENGDKEMVKKILNLPSGDYFIDPNYTALDNFTPLICACNESQEVIAKLLLQYGAEVNSQTSFGRTSLHYAVLRGNFEISHLLLLHGASPNIQDKELNTPLHFAAQAGLNMRLSSIVSLLLKFKADGELKNFQNLTCYQASLNTEIQEIFKSFGLFHNVVSTYSRQVLPGTNILLPNSRHDHVQKLLLMTLKQGNQQSVQQSNNQDDRRDQKRMVQMQQFVEAFTKTRIKIYHQNDQIIQSSKDLSLKKLQAPSQKIGSDSFHYYQMIGSGSFGEVYLIKKKDQNKLYAMKVLNKNILKKQNLMNYVQTEKDVLSIIRHPFIVKLNYAFQNDRHLFLVMDFCNLLYSFSSLGPGGDLSALLFLKKKIQEDVVKLYAAEITLALEILHKNGIIFRDLKPENVVLDEEGHALLTDFGLSKKGVQTDVMSGSFCGSPAYLAPEMLQKKGHNRLVDWYSLGVLIYELIVGFTPYYDKDKQILYENIRKAPLKMPKSITADAKDIILKLLKRNPSKRLGAERDAEEIKQHPWFSSINWVDCYNRKLNTPKPEILNHIIGPETTKPKFIYKDRRSAYLKDWTYCNNEGF